MQTFLLTGSKIDDQMTFTREEVARREQIALFWGTMAGLFIMSMLVLCVMLAKGGRDGSDNTDISGSGSSVVGRLADSDSE